MKSLYERLKPEIKKAIKTSAKKYPHSGRVLIAKLHLHTVYNELTIGAQCELEPRFRRRSYVF